MLWSGLRAVARLAPTKLKKLVYFERGIHERYGWLRSMLASVPIDAEGRPLPWITYPAIDFLRQLDFREKTVLEWGAGHSTLWWADRARSVASIETDPGWCRKLRARLPPNVKLVEVAPSLSASLDAFTSLREEFDVIVVDNEASFRPACSRASLRKLRAGGIVVLDNSDRAPISASILREAGLLQVDFTGFAPSNVFAQSTSVFFDRCCDLRPLGGVQPHPSVAQPSGPWPDA